MPIDKPRVLGYNKDMGYAVFAIITVIGLSAGSACVFSAVRLIKRQIKLNNSITLVELKSGKWFYLFFIVMDLFFIIFTVVTMSGSFPAETVLMEERYGMVYWQQTASLGALLYLCTAAELLFAVLWFAKSAVVDRGIYTALNYLDWYHVHDYIIDESRGVVILSTKKETFATVRGTTAPLRVTKNDIPKLKFILNKNKNKFSGMQDFLKE